MIRRANVVLVFYDLPVTEPGDKKKAARFHKGLLKLGYTFVQKSIYAKVVHNRSRIQSEIAIIRELSPKEGSVNLLRMSLEDFKKMNVVVGNGFDMSLFSDEIIEV